MWGWYHDGDDDGDDDGLMCGDDGGDGVGVVKRGGDGYEVCLDCCCEYGILGNEVAQWDRSFWG